jgi:hypothetical protein
MVEQHHFSLTMAHIKSVRVLTKIKMEISMELVKHLVEHLKSVTQISWKIVHQMKCVVVVYVQMGSAVLLRINHA